MTCGFEEDRCTPLGAVALLYPLPRCRRPSQVVQIRSAVEFQFCLRRAESGWATIRPPMGQSRICGRCLTEPQSALIHSFNCSATATISHPASLSKLPNGCQGHPRFCPSPPDRSPITKPDSNCVLRAATFIQLLAWVDIKMHKAVEA